MDSGLTALTTTELEVLAQVALGKTDKEVAEARCVSVYTIRWHMQHIRDKLHARNRLMAVRIARMHGILNPTTNLDVFMEEQEV